MLTIICILLEIGVCGALFSAEIVAELETKADLFYQMQLNERKKDIGEDFKKLVSRFPCIRGLVPVGIATIPLTRKEYDGHKWVCGLDRISGRPSVLSFGSRGDQNFELELLKLRPDANIHIFDIAADRLPVYRHPNIFYHVTGIGGYPGSDSAQHASAKGAPMKSLHAHMAAVNLTHVDILKIDVEGFEFSFLKAEGEGVLPRVGQLLVEVHMKRTKSMFRPWRAEDALWFVQAAEKTGLRLMLAEPNILNPWSSIELGFIQADWGRWESHKLEGGKSSEEIKGGRRSGGGGSTGGSAGGVGSLHRGSLGRSGE